MGIELDPSAFGDYCMIRHHSRDYMMRPKEADELKNSIARARESPDIHLGDIYIAYGMRFSDGTRVAKDEELDLIYICLKGQKAIKVFMIQDFHDRLEQAKIKNKRRSKADLLDIVKAHMRGQSRSEMLN